MKHITSASKKHGLCANGFLFPQWFSLNRSAHILVPFLLTWWRLPGAHLIWEALDGCWAEQSFDPEAAAAPNQVSPGDGRFVPGLGVKSGPWHSGGSRLPPGWLSKWEAGTQRLLQQVEVWLTSAVALEQCWWSTELRRATIIKLALLSITV